MATTYGGMLLHGNAADRWTLGLFLTEDNIEDQPLVSIVINNYNYGQFLEEAVNSALSQTYPRTEVVVVDDGSTDTSQEIIANFGDQVVSVLKENGGQASACNAGFAASRGDVVIFLDADDYLFPSAAERVVGAREVGVIKVQYRLQEIDALGNPLGLFPPRHKRLDSGVVWPILLEKGRYVTPTTSGNGYARTVLDQILPIPEVEYRNWADTFLNNSVPFHGEIRSINEALGAYRIHGSNMWSLTELSSDKFQTFVRHHMQVQNLLVRKADELGYEAPRDLRLRHHELWSVRLASLRLDPHGHPVPVDQPLHLAYSGLRSVWRYSEFNRKQRILLSAWFVWVGLLPLPLARPAIALMFLPRSRAKAVDWVIEKFIRRRPSPVGSK